MIIFKFDVLVNSSIVEQVEITQPNSSTNMMDDNTPSMPFLKLHSCKCNCSSFPQVGNVLLEAEIENETDQLAHHMRQADIQGAEFLEEFLSACDDETPTGAAAKVCYSETFALKGSTFHKDFQRVLGECKKLRLNKPGSVELRFLEEPININDENAIVVQAKIGDCFSSIGYVPGKKVPKIKATTNEIESVVFSKVQYTYIWGAGEHKYVPHITVTKRGKWLADDKHYKYNI